MKYRMKIMACIVTGCLVLTGGCGSNVHHVDSHNLRTSGHAQVRDSAVCAEAAHGRWVDLADGEAGKSFQVHDLQITRRIELAGGSLIAKKKSTPTKALREQLSRKTCKVKLAKPGGKTTDPINLYDKHRSSVLVFAGIFKCDRCNKWHARPASGFIISEDGKAVTSYHVLAGGNDVTFVAMTGDGKVFAVKEILAASKKDDLAIVQLDIGDAKVKPLVIGSKAQVGSDVHVISHPEKRYYSLTRGIVSRYFKMDNPKKKLRDISMMAITADFAKGSSGGPLLNNQGHVVGIVASTNSVYYNTKDGVQQNLQMVFKQCIPAASLLKLIETKP